jgi:hypothetical protein
VISKNVECKIKTSGSHGMNSRTQLKTEKSCTLHHPTPKTLASNVHF